jgi:hypothetical protein
MAKFYSPSLGFQTSDLHHISDDAVPIADEEWQTLLTGINQLGLVINMVGGVPTLVPKPAPPALIGADLERLRTDLKARIDVDAERQRLRYITGGSGQAMTYARKVEQARAAIADAEPTPESYPLLAASIGIDGATVIDVANVVIGMNAAWEVIGSAIEQVRLSGKATVDAATDEASVRAAFAAVAWPNSESET